MGGRGLSCPCMNGFYTQLLTRRNLDEKHPATGLVAGCFLFLRLWTLVQVLFQLLGVLRPAKLGEASTSIWRTRSRLTPSSARMSLYRSASQENLTFITHLRGRRDR